jgi:hypothetical protein
MGEYEVLVRQPADESNGREGLRTHPNAAWKNQSERLIERED